MSFAVPYAQFNMAAPSLFHIARGRSDDFLRRRQPGHDLARAVFTQRAHAHFPGLGAEHGGGNLVVNQLPRLVVEHEDLKDAEAPLASALVAFTATFALLEVRAAAVNAQGTALLSFNLRHFAKAALLFDLRLEPPGLFLRSLK